MCDTPACLYFKVLLCDCWRGVFLFPNLQCCEHGSSEKVETATSSEHSQVFSCIFNPFCPGEHHLQLLPSWRPASSTPLILRIIILKPFLSQRPPSEDPSVLGITNPNLQEQISVPSSKVPIPIPSPLFVFLPPQFTPSPGLSSLWAGGVPSALP